VASTALLVQWDLVLGGYGRRLDALRSAPTNPQFARRRKPYQEEEGNPIGRERRSFIT
jgi:hypothetical protein